ncbi:YdcH family protein [Uliginosibacterium sediminicola]|uniref:YdcH family protein n=1 Tax=Uliginosibacterium sediminicola TaxID=2024550 RepID=A0ABU9Z154_9RHOO
MMDGIIAQATSLETRLSSLRDEHRQIDDTISHLGQQAAPYDDELVLHRLKKRRLMVRDRITLIERLLTPPSLA